MSQQDLRRFVAGPASEGVFGPSTLSFLRQPPYNREVCRESDELNDGAYGVLTQADASLRHIQFGINMPYLPQENAITYDSVPFERLLYLQQNLDKNGRVRRWYDQNTMNRIQNRGENPFTRQPITPSNVRRPRRKP